MGKPLTEADPEVVWIKGSLELLLVRILINSNHPCLDFAPHQTMLEPALIESGCCVFYKS